MKKGAKAARGRGETREKHTSVTHRLSKPQGDGGRVAAGYGCWHSGAGGRSQSGGSGGSALGRRRLDAGGRHTRADVANGVTRDRDAARASDAPAAPGPVLLGRGQLDNGLLLLALPQLPDRLPRKRDA